MKTLTIEKHKEIKSEYKRIKFQTDLTREQVITELTKQFNLSYSWLWQIIHHRDLISKKSEYYFKYKNKNKLSIK